MNPADFKPNPTIKWNAEGQVRAKLAVEYKANYKKQHVMGCRILY